MTVNPDDLSCKELVELVTDYVEDRLAAEARSRFEMHLAYCGSCRVYLEQIRTTIRLAGRLTEETLPPGSRESLLSAFRSWKRGTGGDA